MPTPPNASPLVGAPRRAAMRLSVVEGVVAQVHTALTGLGGGGNVMSVGLALLLGAGDATLGWMAAIPPLAGVVQLWAARLQDRIPRKAPVVVVTSTLARVLLPVAALLAWQGAAGTWALGVLLALWAVAHGLLAVSTNLWVSWMAALVPAAARARYFSFRTAVCTAAGIAVGLGAGIFLDAAQERGQSAAAFAWLWGLAGVAGVVCAVLLWRQGEPPHRTHHQESSPSDAALSPALRALLLFVALWGFSNGMAAPFWSSFQLEELGLTYTFVGGVKTLLEGVMTAVALPLWGRVAARFGHRAAVVVCMALICSHPAYFVIAQPGQHWPMVMDALSSGVAWGGYNLCIFNLVLDMAPQRSTARIYALYMTVAGLTQAVSAVAGGAFVGLLPEHLDLGVLLLERRQTMFLATLVARLGCLLLFLRTVPAHRAGQVQALIVALPAAVKAVVVEVKFMVQPRR